MDEDYRHSLPACFIVEIEAINVCVWHMLLICL